MSSNKPFPSSDLDVFKENSLILDHFVNSQDNEYPDRFNRKRPTITGIIKEAFNVRTDISNMNETLIGQSRWDAVPKNTSLNLGGDNGALNKQAQALFNRTEMLKIHSREALRRTYLEVGLNLVPGSFEEGAVITSTNDVVLHEKTGKCYSGPIGEVPKGTNPLSKEFVDVSEVISTGFILAKTHGVSSGVDCAPMIQKLQNLSERLRRPIDFTGIDVVTFSGKIQIGDWFHWKSSSRYDTTIRPLTKSRASLGAGPGGVFAWFGPKDPSTSIQFAMLEDIGFDGGYDVGTPTTPSDRLIRAFCFHAHGSAKHTDITALRVHVLDCPHEFWEGYTTGGGEIEGIRMLFCSGDVSDPTVSAVGCNMFKNMNGTIDSPESYGIYTIRNIISFGNTCRGWRTLNDFKRGTELWTITACETIDMNDCHHSADGTRFGTFDASNKGWQTGASRSTKNYLEVQGEDIDILGFHFDADRGGTTKRGQSAIFITDYEYPAHGGDGSNNRRRQSRRVNIRSGFAKNINHNAVRLLNTYKCGVEKILASNCLLGALGVEFVPGMVDTDTLSPISSIGNIVGDVETESCQSEIIVTSGGEVIVKSPPRNGGGGSRLSLDPGSSYRIDYQPKIINHQNTLAKSTDFWVNGGVTKSDFSEPPIGIPYAFELSDTNNASIQAYTWGAKIPVSQIKGEWIYINLWVLKGSAESAALIVQEYTLDDELVTNSFKPLNPGAKWIERKLIHKPSSANVSYVLVKLAPANSDYSSPVLTGSTRFADIRISKDPI